MANGKLDMPVNVQLAQPCWNWECAIVVGIVENKQHRRSDLTAGRRCKWGTRTHNWLVFPSLMHDLAYLHQALSVTLPVSDWEKR
jgi:hypothetical protein